MQFRRPEEVRSQQDLGLADPLDCLEEAKPEEVHFRQDLGPADLLDYLQAEMQPVAARPEEVQESHRGLPPPVEAGWLAEVRESHRDLLGREEDLDRAWFPDHLA